MKRVLFLIVAIILFGFTLAAALPPDEEPDGYKLKAGGSKEIVEGQEPIAWFGSLGYTDAVQVEVGVVFPMLIDRLYGYTTLMGGDYGASISLKAAYLFWLGKGGFFGFTGGAQSDWFDTEMMGVVNYMNTATGLWGGYSFGTWGLFGQYDRVVPDFPENKEGLESFNRYRIGIYANIPIE